MKRLLILALPLLILLASCDDKIDLKLNDGAAYLDVDAAIDDLASTRDTVRVLTTVGYLDQAKLPGVSGAQVVLSGTDGTNDTLPEIKPGYYLVPENFAGLVGQTYTLDIVTPSQEHYQASAQMPRAQVLDSITITKKQDEFPYEDGYYVGLWYQELPGKGDNFKFELTINDTLQNLPRQLFAVNDDLADGAFVRGTILNRRALHVEDTVIVSVVSITKDALDFYNELQTQINNGGLFSQPPANVRTNVVNLTPGSNTKTTGYFFVQGRSTKGIRVKPL